MKTQLLDLSTGAGRPLGGVMMATTESVVELPPRPFVPATPGRAATAIAAQRLSEFDLQYDADQKILWCYFDFTGRPCFSSTVLEEAQRIQRLVRTLGEEAPEEGPIRYLVLGSRAPGVWNRGGAVEQRDRRRAQRALRLAGDPLQPVPGHGRLYFPVAPRRAGPGRAHDPQRRDLHRRAPLPAWRGRRARRRWRGYRCGLRLYRPPWPPASRAYRLAQGPLGHQPGEPRGNAAHRRSVDRRRAEAQRSGSAQDDPPGHGAGPPAQPAGAARGERRRRDLGAAPAFLGHAVERRLELGEFALQLLDVAGAVLAQILARDFAQGG